MLSLDLSLMTFARRLARAAERADPSETHRADPAKAKARKAQRAARKTTRRNRKTK